MNPQTAGPIVLDTLTRAGSQTAEVFKPAAEQLKEWETQPGFYSILLSIFTNHTIDVNVRWLAVLYFKNGVDKYWRRMAPNAMSEEEKKSLKQQLIANFNEPFNQIATQISVLIAKIARLDCPASWQDLIPTILEAVKCNDALIQQRSLLTLYHVTKTLASKRLASDRKLFEELTNNVFEFVLTLWNTHTETLIKLVQMHDTENVILAFDFSILSLKVLRRLVVYGFKQLEKSQCAVMFLDIVFQRIDEFLKAKGEMGYMSQELLPRREKKLTLLTKVLLDVQEMHQEAYVMYMQRSLEMTVRYNFTEEGKDLVFERFAVNAFNIMRFILRCETYKAGKTQDIEDVRNPVTKTAHKIKMDFFTKETLTEICRRVISHYFLLTAEDLENWDNDPEEYICDESGDSWKFSIRACTENLYMTLFKEFRDELTPVVMELVKEHQALVDPQDLNAILRKDAVYNAVGQSSFDLYDDVDFDQWFSQHLIAELQIKDAHYRVIRRRVIWLIGCWVGVKLSLNLRPALYEAIMPLLQQSEDMVVRIEAATTLKTYDFEFKTEQFLPYLERTFSLLFQLLKDVNECESKMQILHVMSFVIERVAVKIRPHAEALIQYLPLLWQESADHNMLKCAILTTLVSLVQGLGPLCVNMYDFLLPVIQLSTDVGQESHVYMLEDGLELWHCTLHCSPKITPELLQVFDNMAPLLELSTETLKVCLKIIESYILLGPKEYLEKYAGQLVTSFASLMTDLRTEGIVMIMKVIELVYKVFPQEGPKIFSQFLPGVFATIIQGEESPMVYSLYLSLFARIILQDQSFYWQALDLIGRNQGKTTEETLGCFLDAWFDKSDNIIQVERKKLGALALASLLSVDVVPIVERMDGIINVCVETMHDVCKTDSDVDCLVMGGTDVEVDELDTEHDRRKRQLSLQDPIHVISLKDYIKEQLSRCQQLHGEEKFNQMMQQVDPDIYNQLQMFMNK